MKRYCKDIDITDKDLIRTAVVGCLAGKKNRRDVKALIQRYGTVDAIVAMMQEEIRARNLQLKPMWYSIKEDGSSGKIRRIGIDAQDVQAHPEKYMSYTPDPQTMESKLEKLTAQINALSKAQLDMATKGA